MRDLKTALHFTVHGNRKSVPQIADECGISTSYLYRACLDGESGCRFPLDKLIPLMASTGDYSVLDHLNARSGRITVSLPRVAKLKRQDPAVVNEINGRFNDVMGTLLKFFENPDPAAVPGLEAILHAHLCEVVAIKRAVKDFRQGDLL